MTWSQIVCSLFAGLTLFGFSITLSKIDWVGGHTMPVWQFIGYVVMLVLAISGAVS